MKTNVVSLKQGLAGFLDGEFLPKYKRTHSAASSYGVAVVAALAIDNLGNSLEQLTNNPLISYLGIVDENRDLDVDKILTFMREKMPNEGLKMTIPMIGTITFNRDDIDSLETYMKLQK